ncbi:MAG: hypothetical protein KDA78_02755, partial [Planctomycetaceae bacterium]|nr:hypothetical protein [Planctomycetaceae bacterium]
MKSLLICCVLCIPVQLVAAELEWIGLSDDGKGFVQTDSGRKFIPWGFNYDHEGDGRLLEDYWHDEWPVVESA